MMPYSDFLISFLGTYSFFKKKKIIADSLGSVFVILNLYKGARLLGYAKGRRQSKTNKIKQIIILKCHLYIA